MKDLFGKNIIKSIIVSLIIFFAVGGISIFVHARLGYEENKKQYDSIQACIDSEDKCNKDEWKSPDDDDYLSEYYTLKERYPEKQAVAYYTRYVSHESSMVWFSFYGKVMLYLTLIGFVVGIGFYFIFSDNSKKESKK